MRLLALTCALVAATPVLAQTQPPAAGALPPLPAPTYVTPAELDLPRVLPAFPAAGSFADRVDVETMLAIQRRRTKVDEIDAQADSVTTMSDFTSNMLGAAKANPASHPKLFALMRALHDDMRGVNRAANAARGFRPRPQVHDTRIKPSLDLVGHGNASYPSARTSSGYVWAAVFGDLFPAMAEAADAEAERIAWRRVVGGVHYPSDLTGSRYVAAQVVERLRANARFRQDLEAVRAETADLRR
jgi:acid phosphatase (class A)